MEAAYHAVSLLIIHGEAYLAATLAPNGS